MQREEGTNDSAGKEVVGREEPLQRCGMRQGLKWCRVLNAWNDFGKEYTFVVGFPNGSEGKESTCNARDAWDLGLVPRLGRSCGGGHGNPLQYAFLENPTDRGARQAKVHRVAKSQTWLMQLSRHAHLNGWVVGLSQNAWVQILALHVLVMSFIILGALRSTF